MSQPAPFKFSPRKQRLLEILEEAAEVGLIEDVHPCPGVDRLDIELDDGEMMQIEIIGDRLP
jgi:hypothetical protein